MLNAGAKTSEQCMRIRRPSRLRRVAKWVGLGVCLLVLAEWAGSEWMSQHYYHRMWRVSLSEGTVNVLVAGSGVYADSLQRRYDTGSGGFIVHPTYHSDCLGLRLPSIERHGRLRDALGINIPLWIPFGLFTTLTSVLFWRDRRTAKPGNCLHCGYNLTGNESGICPECSTPVPKQETTA